jgi:osmoprotectant transport system substrate-binding protein
MSDAASKKVTQSSSGWKSPVPVVNRRAFEKYPALREVLIALGGKFTAEEMRRVNYAVDRDHRDVEDVISEFLVARKL